MHCSPPGSSRQGEAWNFPSKNTAVGCHFLFQGILPTQGSNPHLLCLLHWQVDFFLPLSHMGSRQGGELVCAQSFSHVWLFVTPWTVAHQAPLSMEFSGQEYWNGLLFPTPGDLPDSGIKLGCLALQAVSLPFEPQGKSSPRNKFLVCNSSNQSSQAIGKVQWYLLTFAD